MAIVKTNFYAQSLNQFAPKRVRGDLLDWGLSSLQMEVVIDETETGTLYAGDAVEIVATSTGKLSVKAATSNDAAFGYIVYNSKREAIKAGHIVTVCLKDGVLNCVTEEAIDAGDAVYFNTADGSVTKTAGSNTVRMGRAMAKTTAVSGGQFIPVLLG